MEGGGGRSGERGEGRGCIQGSGVKGEGYVVEGRGGRSGEGGVGREEWGERGGERIHTGVWGEG